MPPHSPKSMEDLTRQLRKKREQLEQGGGPDRLAKQKEQGKLTARQRIAALVDANSFEEFGLFAQHRQVSFGMADKEIPADGVVTGAASVDGRLIHLASQDFTVLGGSAGEVHSLKVADVMHRSLKTGSPVCIHQRFRRRPRAGRHRFAVRLRPGLLRQRAIVRGRAANFAHLRPLRGGAAYSPALTDFVIQTRQAQMFITGPQVMKQVTGEDISAEQLGGADAHMAHSGVIHFVAEDDNDAIYLCRRLLSFLPSNNLEEPPHLPTDRNVDPNPALADAVPIDSKQSYDVRTVIMGIVDQGDFLEVQAGYAMNMVVGFARMVGRSIGIIANQPAVLAGAIDINAATKAARFIRFCNAFNIPIVTFVDVPGYLPGVQQEYGGIIRNGAKLLFAYSAATVPKIQVILRKSYGGAHVAMCSKDLGADCAFAWPTAEVAVMGAEGAVEIVFRKEMQDAPDKAAKRAELIEQYRAAFASPYVAAGRRLVDDIIEPANTRKILAQTLEYLQNKREQRPPKKHGLIPL